MLKLALEPLRLELGHLAGYRIDAQPIDLAADVDRAVVHRIAQVLAGIAQDHHAPALHHEAAERAGAAADDDRAALHVDADARADIALADEIAAAHRGAESRARVLLDHHRPGEHVLGARPADTALDVDVGPVDQAAAEIAEAPFDGEVEAVEDADGQGVLGARILHDDGAEPWLISSRSFKLTSRRTHRRRVELRALLEVDFEGLRIGESLLLFRPEEALLGAPRELLGVHSEFGRFGRDCHDLISLDQFCQTRTSPS